MFTGYVLAEDWMCWRDEPRRRWQIRGNCVLSADDEVLCELREKLTESGHRSLRIYGPDGVATAFFVFHGYVYGPTGAVPWADAT